MEPTKQTTYQVRGCIYPHGHENPVGPAKLILYPRARPQAIDRKKVYVHFEQPDPDRSNLTLLRMLVGNQEAKKPTPDGNWKHARAHLAKRGELMVYIKVGNLKRLPHPIPYGMWDGFLLVHKQYLLYTFQAVSLRPVKIEPKKQLVTPEDYGHDGKIVLPSLDELDVYGKK